MPHPDKVCGPRTNGCHPVFRSWPFLLLGLVLGIAGMPIAASTQTATLNEIRVGDHGDFIRIVFEFSGPVPYQLTEDVTAGSIAIRLMGTITPVAEELAPVTAGCLDQVTISQQDGLVLASLQFYPLWNAINPFIIRDPNRLVLDVYCAEASGAPDSHTEIQAGPAVQEQVPAPENRPEAGGPVSAPAEEQAMAALSAVPQAPEPTPPSKQTIGRTTEPTAPTTVANQEKDPLQTYLLMLLAAITGVIIGLIALIAIQKRRGAAGSDAAVDHAPADPDETMRAIDTQIKAKLMQYDDRR